jgi:hypothetical protein
MSTNSVRIISYTDKSIVVIGDTKKYKDSLKNLGGKWNASLTNRETGEKFMGWIFYLSKQREVQSWIDNGSPDVVESKIESKTESKQSESQPKMSILAKPKVLPSPSSDDRIRQLEKSIEMLIAKVASLEIEVSTLKKGTPKDDEVEDEEDEEVQTPPKRLLRR